MKISPSKLHNNRLNVWKRLFFPLCLALALSVSAMPHSWATELPSGVLHYLRQKDPRVKVRFDAVVVFSNGETYVPVIPQDPSLNPDSQQVVATIPEKAAYPDLIQFDNNFFLMRLIQTTSGRLTFPKMTEYPIQLKEGLLPQDFVLPDNLFIPVELKVILGALPYNPNTTASTTPDVTPLHLKNGKVVNSPLPDTGYQLKSTVRLTYVFDLAEQKLIGIDTITGRKQGEVTLDCVPSSLKLSNDGKLLFVPCLSTNELVVIDTGSNLVKTRVPVGQRPDAVLYLDNSRDVLVSNRFSPFLSVLNIDELIGGHQIDLPGNGGAMVAIPGGKLAQVAVADAFKAQIYMLDTTTGTVIKTLKAVEDISALHAFRDRDGQVLIWALSRTKGQLVVIDPDKDTIVKTLDTGAKPVDMAEYDGKLYVVSAGASQVDVVDRKSQSVTATIPLDADAFPAGIVTMNDEKRAYVVTAAANNLVVINLGTNQVENTFPVEFRANMIATVPDLVDTTPEPGSTVPALPAHQQSITKTIINNPDKDAEDEKSSSKRHGLFGKREADQSDEPQKKNELNNQAKPQLGSSNSMKPASTVVSRPGAGQSPKTAAEDTVAAPVVIPAQPGSTSNSPLYGESPGKVRLILGKKTKKSVVPEAEVTPQATKAGARLPNPAASSASPDNASSTEAQPKALLMMAPDVQK